MHRIVANVINAMASQQAVQQMEKILERKKMSPAEQKRNYDRLKKARRQELLVIAQKITNECVVTMDNPRIVRYVEQVRMIRFYLCMCITYVTLLNATLCKDRWHSLLTLVWLVFTTKGFISKKVNGRR